MDSLGRTETLFHRHTTQGGINDIKADRVARAYGPGPSYIRDELSDYQKMSLYSEPAGIVSITPNVSQ